MSGGGEDLGQGLPEAESSVADRQDGGAHPPTGAVAQQVRPGLARLAVAVLERGQFLVAIRAHADEDEYAGFGFLQADIEVDAGGPHIHVVDLREVAVHERGVVGLPLLGQPRDRCRRQPGRTAKELLQRGHEVAGGQAVQIEQRQHLADLRALAAPGGRIAEENRLRSPVSSSTRLPFTRGAFTSTTPAAVVTFLGWW